MLGRALVRGSEPPVGGLTPHLRSGLGCFTGNGVPKTIQ